MVFRRLVVLLVALMAGFAHPALAQASPSIEGLWRASDGSGSALIATCTNDVSALCASEIAVNPDVLAAGRVVVRDLRQTSAGEWRGTYLSGRDALPAAVKLRSPDLAAMTACRWLLCQTVTYRRVVN